MKKRVGSLTEMHPLTLTIDAITALPESIKVISESEEQPCYTFEELNEIRRRRKQELREGM